MLVHVDTAHGHEQLINSRLAYVSVSRRRYDAQIYTNNAGQLAEGLSSDVSKPSALASESELARKERIQAVGQAQDQPRSESHGQTYSHGIGH